MLRWFRNKKQNLYIESLESDSSINLMYDIILNMNIFVHLPLNI